MKPQGNAIVEKANSVLDRDYITRGLKNNASSSGHKHNLGLLYDIFARDDDENKLNYS